MLLKTSSFRMPLEDSASESTQELCLPFGHCLDARGDRGSYHLTNATAQCRTRPIQNTACPRKDPGRDSSTAWRMLISGPGGECREVRRDESLVKRIYANGKTQWISSSISMAQASPLYTLYPILVISLQLAIDTPNIMHYTVQPLSGLRTRKRISRLALLSVLAFDVIPLHQSQPISCPLLQGVFNICRTSLRLPPSPLL